VRSPGPDTATAAEGVGSSSAEAFAGVTEANSFDFIVVGSGPAGSVLVICNHACIGITILTTVLRFFFWPYCGRQSRRLVDRGFDVLLLEAGGPTQYDLGGKHVHTYSVGLYVCAYYMCMHTSATYIAPYAFIFVPYFPFPHLCLHGVRRGLLRGARHAVRHPPLLARIHAELPRV
jgi:hypothetical protein